MRFMSVGKRVQRVAEKISRRLSAALNGLVYCVFVPMPLSESWLSYKVGVQHRAISGLPSAHILSSPVLYTCPDVVHPLRRFSFRLLVSRESC